MKFKEMKSFFFHFVFLDNSEGPFVRLTTISNDENFKDWVRISWHSFTFILSSDNRCGIGHIHLKLK